MAILRNAKKFFGKAKGKFDDIISGARKQERYHLKGPSKYDVARKNATSQEYDRIIGEQSNRLPTPTEVKTTTQGSINVNPKIDVYNQQTNDSIANEIANKREQATRSRNERKRQEYTESKKQRMSGDHSQGSGNKAKRRTKTSDEIKIENATKNFNNSDHGIEMERQRKKQEHSNSNSSRRQRAQEKLKNNTSSDPGVVISGDAGSSTHEINAAQKQYDSIISDEAILKNRQAYKEQVNGLTERPDGITPEQNKILDEHLEKARADYQASKDTMTTNEQSLYDDEMLTRQESEFAEMDKQLAYDEKNRHGIKRNNAKSTEQYYKDNPDVERPGSQRAKETPEAKLVREEKEFEASRKAKLQQQYENNKKGTGSAQASVNKEATEKMKSTMGEQMGKWAPMVVGGGLVIAMANRGGQQTNAELYGQSPAYGGGY